MSKNNGKVRPGWAGSGDHITNKGIAKRKAEVEGKLPLPPGVSIIGEEKFTKDMAVTIESQSAAHIRAKELKSRHRHEKPIPKSKYEVGDTVFVPDEYCPPAVLKLYMEPRMFICCAEWGGDNHRTLPGDDVWYYFLRIPGDQHLGKQHYSIIPEDKILGKVNWQ